MLNFKTHIKESNLKLIKKKSIVVRGSLDKLMLRKRGLHYFCSQKKTLLVNYSL